MRKRWMSAVALIALLFGLLATGRATAASDIAPPIELNDYQGSPHKLSELRGRYVLLNFWASWCGPCQEELPELARLSKKYEGQVAFVGVNLAVRDDKEVSQALLQKAKVPYLNLLDAEGRAAVSYRVAAIPTTFVIDPQGRIVGKVMGANVPLIESVLKRTTEAR